MDLGMNGQESFENAPRDVSFDDDDVRFGITKYVTSPIWIFIQYPANG